MKLLVMKFSPSNISPKSELYDISLHVLTVRGCSIYVRPPPKLKYHPLSSVHCCLFNMFSSVFHVWRPSPPSAN